MGEWHPLLLCGFVERRQDGWLSSRPNLSRSLIKGIVSPKNALFCLPEAYYAHLSGEFEMIFFFFFSFKLKCSPFFKCGTMIHRRLVFGASRRGGATVLGELNLPNLKRRQLDKQSLQSRVCARPSCVTLKARYLKFSGGLRHRGSCLAIRVTLIASEHFQISLKNNMLCSEPWGL